MRVWRPWVYAALTSPAISALVPADRVVASGGMITPPETPFITFVFGTDLPRLRGDGREITREVQLDVWCHDDQGTYDRIDEVLDAVRAEMLARVPPLEGFEVRAQGRSMELADDVLDTLKRSESFALPYRR